MKSIKKLAPHFSEGDFFIQLSETELELERKFDSQSFYITREGLRYFATEFSGTDRETGSHARERELTPRFSAKGIAREIALAVKEFDDYWLD